MSAIDFKREQAIKREKELIGRIQDYLDVKETIPTGMKLQETYQKQKERILEVLGGTEKDWENYDWQHKNRISDVETLSKIINLTERERSQISEIGNDYRWAISPYYASLMDENNAYDPIRLLAVPSALELMDEETDIDPMGEEFTNPAGSITRRYPDRLIIYTTNECAMYCRHCQRRRKIGGSDSHTNRALIDESIEYVRNHPEIRDVLLTGGDVLTLSTDNLEYIIKSLVEIEHIDYVRLGSRVPVTVPQRIDQELIDMLKKYVDIKPIYLNTHFNTPKEVTEDAKRACSMLANAGVSIGNQAVLLNGINNDKFVMRLLNQELLKIRVRPYYIFHAKHVAGTSHFITSVDDGIEIMEYLRGYTSGMAIPTYIINAPGGKGKTPILPQYMISRGPNYVTIRTWEGEVIQYENHPTVPLNFGDK